MKSLLALRLFVALFAALAPGLLSAQTAALSSDTTVLAAEGGTVTLTAVVQYDGTPGALAWSIALPADWTLLSVAGPQVPAIAPETGSTGTLEFAYTATPKDRAEFSIQVRYPANAATARAVPKVLVRADGKLLTLTPAAVELRAGGGQPAQGAAN